MQQGSIFMAKRKDGKETRRKLLDTACEVFAEKGFQAAKVTEICRRAGVNVAAVSYYFGDKESLYTSAWRQTVEDFLSSDIPPPEDLPPEERLFITIRSIIRKILSIDTDKGYFRRLEMMEMANPTGLVDNAWKELIGPRQQKLLKIIRDIMGPAASENAVRLCGMSIINQCRGYILMQKNRLAFLESEELTPEKADQIIEHISRFSIAGIKGVCNS